MADNLFFHLIVLAAGFTQGFAGFGFALVMLPLLTMLTGIKTVIPLVILLGVCVNVILFVQIRRYFEWKKVHILLLASVPGILCGVYILKVMSTSFLELVVGFVLIVFSAYLLSKKVPEREIAAWWEWPVGFISGVLGGSVAAGGPPVIIYMALQPWEKYSIKSTLVGFFLVTRLGICVAQAGSGLITHEILILFTVGLPALISGVSIGSFLFNKVGSDSYRKVLKIMLIILGVFMVARAMIGE